MFTGVSFEKAIDYYRKGKEVIVLDRNSCGSNGQTGYDTFPFQDLFGNLDFLVDLPAVSNPDFEQAVQDMMRPNMNTPHTIEPYFPGGEPKPIESKREEPDSKGILEEAPPGGAIETEKQEVRDMTGKSNKEKACELLDQGMNMKEISRTLGISYNTVYYWFRGSKGKDKNQGSNADRHKCRTCQYRASGYDKNNTGMNCNYIEIVGCSRGCSVEECNVYKRGKRLTTRGKRKTNEEKIAQ